MASMWLQENAQLVLFTVTTRVCGGRQAIYIDKLNAGCGSRSEEMVSKWCRDADVNKAAGVHAHQVSF